VVVAVGLTLVEPLADSDVKAPGVMAILVAPLVSQLSVLPAPEFMFVGAAVKEVIAGAEPAPPDPEDEFDWIGEVQPASPAQANSISTIAQGLSPEARSPLVLSPILQTEPAEPMRPSWVVIDDVILATPYSLQSVHQKSHRSQGMTLVIRKIVGKQTALRATLFEGETALGTGRAGNI
jgi:hypothetical protein